ncbi:unnamed protein product [Durusdinium trenchii]|uniref:L-serine ammonia-lyase n=1 Tax=Durusdinium trenchii TaxID=1381693 RepID=A0ABP0R661_9DINO
MAGYDIEDGALKSCQSKDSVFSNRSCSHCSVSGSGVALFDTPGFVQGAQRSSPFIDPIGTSVFELLKIGIGPSSSHTVGPMLACRNFAKRLAKQNLLSELSTILVELRGSLALTGIGHGTNKACVLGLHGVAPAEVDPATIEPFLLDVKERGKLLVGFKSDFKEITFSEEDDILLVAEELPLHPNAMICRALSADYSCLLEVRYYSTGGGFILSEEEMLAAGQSAGSASRSFPIAFRSMAELLSICEERNVDIASVVRTNEEARRSPEEVSLGLGELWAVMEQCIQRGLEPSKANALLPGPLQIHRQAPQLYATALEEQRRCEAQDLRQPVMDELRWLNCYALAVMEENACMGRLVTAPTNGAAGVVPAVLAYYMRHLRPTQPESEQKDPATFLLTAATVGVLAKEHACISGAAGGCQAEVGTATAMAAAGLMAVLNGTPRQVAAAATSALEHSLGMTCDPVLGLVQAPCIERNSMGATKAVNAVALVRSGASQSLLDLDGVLRVMKETGSAMDKRYRETALGGLAADYERSLQETPQLQEVVTSSMGFQRIQHGTKKQLKRQVTYEDLEQRLVFQRMESQAVSKC